jgi:hypothetical protein
MQFLLHEQDSGEVELYLKIKKLTEEAKEQNWTPEPLI